jgi:hypothetical protein
MSAAELPPEELVELALEAIGDRDPERLRPLLSPRIRITTGRGTHEGTAAALRWAAKGYEYLDRRFALEELVDLGPGMLGRGRVEYVWRDSGEVGDARPAFFTFTLSDGLLAGLTLHDDEQSARAALAS